MALVLDEQQTMLHDSVRDFLEQEAPVAHLRGLRDQRHQDGVSRDLWRNFGYMGYAGTTLPEVHGGLGLGQVEVNVVMEEIGRNLTPSPFWSTSVVSAGILMHGGTETQKQLYLPSIGTGKTVISLALEERGKHDPDGVQLQARQVGDEFVLDGTKTFVVDGHIAETLLVVARTDASVQGTAGLSLFLVDVKTPGVHIERTFMIDSHNASRIIFDAVSIPSSALLGKLHFGWCVLEPVLEVGRSALASELVGVAEEVLNRTLAFLKERVQFGRRIGEFQALQHRISRVYAQVELARAATMKAAEALDGESPLAGFLVAVAKAKAGSVATHAVQEAVQMHGGMGVTDELDIGLFMQRARVLDELLGDHRFHARRIAVFNGY